MLYAIALHSLAGVLTGSLFKVRTLAFLLVLILSETAFLTAFGVQVAALWIATNLAAMQVGYVAGVLSRRAAAQAGYLVPPTQIQSP